MKVYGKYLVKAYVDENESHRVAASFMTMNEAKTALDMAFQRIGENLWKDRFEMSIAQKFYITKNTKEWKF